MLDSSAWCDHLHIRLGELSVLQPGRGGSEQLKTRAQKQAAIINMCSHSRIKTVLSKSHNRRSCCSTESDMNTYERWLFFFLQMERQAAAVLAFVLRLCLPPPPPLLLPIKGLSVHPWFISWIKQDSIILLIKINSCELRGTLDVYVLTRTHAHTCYVRARLSSFATEQWWL